MSRYGESSTVSGTGMSRSAHSACSARVVLRRWWRTVSAVRVSGRVARA